MRVTAEAKVRTEQAILEAADGLFCEKGFAATSTREIAAGARVAAGTVFNYFPSKEALAAALLERELERATADFSRRRTGGEGLREGLFLLISGQLRRLESRRGVVEGAVGSLVDPGAPPAHVDEVAALVREHGRDPDESPVTLHLYRTLHAGVLAFWLRDESHGREDTLALLDRVTQLFVESLGPDRAQGGA